METYRKLAVRISAENSNGSGSIIHIDKESNFILVATAKHCVCEANEIRNNIEIHDYEDENLEVIGEPVFSNDDVLDIAVIKIKSHKEYPYVLLGEPKRGQNVLVYGYPDILSEYQTDGELLNGRVNEVVSHNNGLVKLSVNQPLSTFDNDELENVEGYSGSAVYYEEGVALHLIGIIIELRGTGQQNGINAIHVNQIEKLVKEQLDLYLIPYSLNDFKSYFQEVYFEQDEDEQKYKFLPLLEKSYKKIEGSSPYDIIQQYSEENKLILTGNKEYNQTEKHLWIGWLRLLLYKAMQLNNNFQIEHFIGLERGTNVHMVFTNEKLRKSFVKQLVQSSFFDEIRTSDILFVSNDVNGFHEDSQKITRQQIQGIVDQIDQTKISEAFYIDETVPRKSFLTVHIQYLINKINVLLDDLSDCRNTDFEAKFVTELNEIFERMEEEE